MICLHSEKTIKVHHYGYPMKGQVTWHGTGRGDGSCWDGSVSDGLGSIGSGRDGSFAKKLQQTLLLLPGFKFGEELGHPDMVKVVAFNCRHVYLLGHPTPYA
jgi:hypothetical protein